MNTSLKIKSIALSMLFCSITISNAFAQSVTILPKSQKNTDTLTTKFFRMTDGAGIYKVMISDQSGNGIWIDPTFFTNIYWALNNSSHLYQVPSVNLGVGTDSPAYKLDVRNTASPTVANFSGSSTSGVGIRLSSGVTGTIDELPVSTEWQLFHSGTGITSENGGYGQLHFKDQNGTKMILRNNGRLGIGVLNPSEMIEVNGNARINGRIDIRSTGNSVFIGEEAGKNDDLSDNYNTFVGFNAGQATVNAGNNVAIGAGSLEKNVSGDENTAIGRLALINNISGTHNIALGTSAGFNATGSYNVFVGYNAGAEETGNNKLYIHNSNSDTPLIYGDFLERKVGVNGRLLVGSHTPYENALKLDVLANADVRFIVPDWESFNNTIIGSRLISSTGLGPQMRFEGAGSSFIDIGQDGNGSFVVEGGDNSRLVVTNAGKVGLGTEDPDSQLEIFTANN